jgi:hypothetical protein
VVTTEGDMTINNPNLLARVNQMATMSRAQRLVCLRVKMVLNSFQE